MAELTHQFEKYVDETLGIPVVTQPWTGADRLLPYLRDLYHFFRMTLLGREYILMADASDAERTPAVIRKHLEHVDTRHERNVIYVRRAVSSYNRKRLIDQKIPFVVPGNQMYIPELGIDLREHFRQLKEPRAAFSPATQALLLFILWQRRTVPVTPSKLARQLNYSVMTMSRAVDELEIAGIGERVTGGRTHGLRLVATGHELWEKSLPHLTTPVRRRFFVSSSAPLIGGKRAGQSALAQYTMISEPRVPTLALSAGDWHALAQSVSTIDKLSSERATQEVEIWTYPPALFSDHESVDRLSLFLSLQDNSDERIQSALDELLRGMEW